mmetsp:Transcript_33579/g.67671  ORF Transcript_33579/g.67671 Transcript_33579/m.67671 type:complete len:119 (-) Transcript_33579:51-407(-)
MSTAALGEEFAEELLVVAGQGLPQPPASFGGGGGGQLQMAAERAVSRAAHWGLELEVVVLAPARGNIARLLAAMKAHPEWASVAKRTVVALYSGSFNVRGSTPEDVAAIAEMARGGGP